MNCSLRATRLRFGYLLIGISVHYSDLKLFTGFINAAFTA